jgi:dolichol kinase
MSQTLALESKPAALELHRLLKDIDPSRWRADVAAAARARAASLARRFAEVWQAAPSERIAGDAGDIARLLAQLPETEEQAAWARFRAQLGAAYESLSVSLRAEAVVVPNLRPTNYRRSLFHALTSVAILLLIEHLLIDRMGGWLLFIVPAVFAVTFWSLEVARVVSERARTFLLAVFRAIAHPHERYRVNSSTWFATALTILGLVFEPHLCAVGVIVLGIADPAAALVGRRWGKTRLVGQRSLEGTATFAIVAFAMSLAVLSLWHTDLLVSSRLLVAGGAAIAGALAELFSRRIDDNFSIPLAAAAGGWLALAFAG